MEALDGAELRGDALSCGHGARHHPREPRRRVMAQRDACAGCRARRAPRGVSHMPGQTRRTTRVAVPRHRSLRAAVPPAPMASPSSRSTPRMGSFVQRVLHPPFSKGACGDADVPQVPPLACAGDRHGILPQEASPLDAVELSVCEAVRARRRCDTNSVRLRAGGLANVSPPVLVGTSGMSCLPVRWLPGPVAACGAIEASPGPQPCLTRTPGLHPSNAGADGGRVAPGTAATPCPWTILPRGVTMAANPYGCLRRYAPFHRGERS